MPNSTAKQEANYFQQLSQPNPLQKKCLKIPRSIFPFVQLPEFQFSQIQTDLLPAQKESSHYYNSPEKGSIRSRSVSPLKKNTNKNVSSIFQVEQSQLQILFESPLYSFSKRLSKGSNKNFCNIKVFPQESHEQPQIQEDSNIFIRNDSHEQNLFFESRFQSGNLAMATKSKIFENQYYLLLTKDFNTARCTQWFFFKISNIKKSRSIFHILNFFKNYSSFQYGMQFCYASKSNKYIWTRGGTNIQYHQRNLYALSFTFDFKFDDDITYFSYSFPYTYTHLDRLLMQLEQENPSIFRRKLIGESLGKNAIEMITITNFKIPSNEKRTILITARVHPGQTPSSFVMEGIIKKLIEISPQLQNARQKFIFKLIPMLNPDGVINGNYRCSLSGYDLNRIWNKCQKEKYPQIYSIKKELQYSKKPFLFIDLHGHSKKKGIFMYGCNIRNNPFLCRQIPFVLWKNISQFNYYQCKFSNNSRQRQGTARMSLFKQYGVNLSYTMQHSFCCPLKVRRHFTAQNYFNIGINLVLTIQRVYGRRRKQGLNENQNDDILQELYQNKQLLKVGQNQDDNSSSDSQIDARFQVEIEQEIDSKLSKIRPKSKIIWQSATQNLISRQSQGQLSHNFVLSRVSSFRQKGASQSKICCKKNPWQKIPKIGFNPDQLLKHSQEMTNLQQFGRDNYVSLQRNQESFMSKKFIKSNNRYCEDQVNNLTDLFLPSVTSSSYKKYNKTKGPIKGMVHVGRKFLENAGILKDQIKSFSKRKIQWKGSGKTCL